MGRMAAHPGDPYRISFVCTGNICRSPMAEVVLRALADRAEVGELVVSTSAGTGDWHVGEHADERTVRALARRGYDGASHRARQFTTAEFAENDLIVALDRTHERVLRSWAPDDSEAEKVVLLLAFDADARGRRDVPDPYYAEDGQFDEVLGMIESATRALFAQLQPALRAASPSVFPPPGASS